MLDLSIEGAKLLILGSYPIKEGDCLTLVVNGKNSFKIKGKVKWIIEGNNMVIGLKFDSLDMETSQVLSEFLSSLALSSLSDTYLK